MHKWRKSAVHSKPSSVAVDKIKTSSGPEGPPRPEQILGKAPFENFVTYDEARNFYKTACDVINLVIEKASHDPRPFCEYTSIDQNDRFSDGEKIRIERDVKIVGIKKGKVA